MATGQTLNDRLTAAKHALAGQGLARIVCKATTEEVIGPKKKHLDYLLHCTNEPNVSIPQLANLLIERTQQASWVVVFKALVTVHHLMCYGNERFTQYLASSNCTFQLSSFLDKQGYDMSTFIRRYAKYLNEKAMSYRAVAFDFCKAKRGKEDGTLRTMPTDKLLKALPILQAQLDALVEFDCTSNDLGNGVINSCFMLLFRDLIRLFACYNDGIINLLEKYFDMNKKSCREALDIYKKFLIRMDRVGELLKVAENVGIDKGDIPDLTKAPSSLLDALEQHLAVLEGKKAPTSTTSASATALGNQPNLQHAVSALQSTSFSFNRVSNGASDRVSNGASDMNGSASKNDDTFRRAVEEEADAMNKMKSGRDSPYIWDQPEWTHLESKKNQGGYDTTPPSTKTNPFLASPEPSSQAQGLLDLFSMSPPQQAAQDNDLLGLVGSGSAAGNPFADSLFGTTATSQQSVPFVSFDAPSNGLSATSMPASMTKSAEGFGNEVNFAAAFGSESNTGLSAATMPACEMGVGGSGLTLRTASPSPTAELMRGAGTTPILGQPSVFGEMTDSTEDEMTWGPPTQEPSIMGSTAPSVTPTSEGKSEMFGGSVFEPTGGGEDSKGFDSSPWPDSVDHSAAHSGKSDVDFFGLDGPFEEANKSKSSSSGNIAAPPPSPFGGLDIGLGMPAPPSSAAQSSAAIAKNAVDDLNFAIQMAMQPNKASPPARPPLPVATVLPLSTSSSSINRMDILGGFAPQEATSPMGLSSPSRSTISTGSGFDTFGDVLQPQSSSSMPSVAPMTAGKVASDPSKSAGAKGLIKGDLDSCLASLCQNLDINGPNLSIKPASHQWGSPKMSGRTGGSTWAPPAAAPANIANWGGQNFPPAAGNQWGGAPPPAAAGIMGAAPFTQPVPAANFPIGGIRPMGVIPPMGNLPPAMGPAPGQPNLFGPPAAATRGQAPPVNDPFGAL